MSLDRRCKATGGPVAEYDAMNAIQGLRRRLHFSSQVLLISVRRRRKCGRSSTFIAAIFARLPALWCSGAHSSSLASPTAAWQTGWTSTSSCSARWECSMTSRQARLPQANDLPFIRCPIAADPDRREARQGVSGVPGADGEDNERLTVEVGQRRRLL